VPEGADRRLTDAQIELVTTGLRHGEYLDDYLRPLLFREAREYELGYAAKEPKSRVLAETMAVPLQPLKRFGEAHGRWRNRLVFGDNLQVLKTLVDMKARGELLNADGSSGVRLCYIDPPFSTRQEFQGRRGARAYRDKVAGAAFVEFLRKRLIFIYELLADDGSLYMHLDTRKVHYLKVILDELFGEQNFRNEVIWKRTTAHSSADRYAPVHDTILVYAKGPLPVWTPGREDYEEEYLNRYYKFDDGDGRLYWRDNLCAAGTRKGSSGKPWRGIDPAAKGMHWKFSVERLEELDAEGRIYWPPRGTMPQYKRYRDELKGKALSDLWDDVNRINPVGHERVGYPTQKPEALLERIIEASSGPGDIVLDCFSGSGTTAVVAQRTGRRWLAVDCGKLAVYITQRRLLSINGTGPLAAQADYELCNAGLYDNDIVEGLPFDGFTAFCLELFNCRPDRHRIGGIGMAGTRKGGPVHFFPFTKTEAEMGRDYVESLHGRLRGKVSGEVYVVAPVTACDPGLFEDVIVIEKVTYFILRVPYSVIEALHGRHFKLLDQPFSEQMLNDPMETFGFDFMQLPEVEVAYSKTNAALRGTISSFMRGGLDPDDFAGLEDAGRLDLAMVLADRSYDGEVFRVSDHFFGDALEQASWTFELPLSECGERVLVIFMDTHGNEFREVVEVGDVKASSRRRSTTPARTRTAA
jgi:hypothetical protein